jgi:hypothetical protein
MTIIVITPTTTSTMPRAPVDVIREPIALRKCLGQITLFHANVQICNDSARTIYILMRVESRADASAAAAIPQHALEPGYSHLYSIPRGVPSARVTIALCEPDDNGGSAIYFIALCSNLRLLSGERLLVTDCCC